MRRLVLHLAIWILTFTTGTSFSALWESLSTTPAVKQQPVVVEHPNVYSSDEEQLFEIERQYVAAEQHHDVAFFDAIEAEDYKITESDGTVLTKAEALAEMRGDDDYPVLTIDDVQIRVYGDTAVVTGCLNEMCMDKGEAYTDQTRWTDVFVRRDGQWKIVSTQVTAVDDEDSPDE